MEQNKNIEADSVFQVLQGIWAFNRAITGHGSMKGTANFRNTAPETLDYDESGIHAAQAIPDHLEKTNTHALGEVLYTHYVYLFQVSGLILLVAMIGAIALTLRARPNVKRQNISDQINRNPKDVLKIEKITTGAGVS